MSECLCVCECVCVCVSVLVYWCSSVEAEDGRGWQADGAEEERAGEVIQTGQFSSVYRISSETNFARQLVYEPSATVEMCFIFLENLAGPRTCVHQAHPCY